MTTQLKLESKFERYPYLEEGKKALESHKLGLALKQFNLAFRVNKAVFLEVSYLLYSSFTASKDPLVLVALAEFYLDTKHPQKAIEELEDAAFLDPKLENIYLILSKYFQKTKESKKVIELCENAIQKDIYYPSIIDILSNFYLSTEQYHKSISLYEKLILLKPSHQHFRFILAELYLRNKSYDKAYDQLAEVYTYSPQRYEEILNLLSQILKQSSYHPESLLLQIRIYLKHLEAKTALPSIKKLLKTKKQLHALAKVLSSTCSQENIGADFHLLLAECHLLLTAYTDCVNSLEKAFQIDPLQANIILSLNKRLLLKEKSCIEAIFLNIDIWASQENFSVVFETMEVLLKTYPSAAKGIEERLITYAQNSPQNILIIQKSLAYCYLVQEEYQKCLNLCDLILIETQCPKTQALQIQALSLAQKLENALIQYDKLIKGKVLPKIFFETYACLEKGLVLEKEQALPDNTFSKGLKLLQQKEALKALHAFQSISQNESNYPIAQALCGRCFIETGRFDMANDLFNFVVNKYPEVIKDYKKSLLYWMTLNSLNLGNIGLAIHYTEEIYKLDMSFLQIDQKLKIYQQKSQLDLRGKALALVFIEPAKNDLLAINCTNPENLKNSRYSKGFQAISFAQNHNNDGVKHLLQKNISSAETAFHLAFQLDPHLASVLSNNCLTSLLQNHKDKEKKIENLIESQAKFPIAQLLITVHFILEEQLDDAKKWAEKALTKAASESIAALLLGDIYYRKNEASLAAHYWQIAAKDDALFFLLKKREYELSDKILSPDYWLNSFTLKW